MRSPVLLIEKPFSTSPSVVKTLTDYLGQAHREAWQSLRNSLRLNPLWGAIPPRKSHSFEMIIRSRTDEIESTVDYFQQRMARYFQRSDAVIANIGLCLRESLVNAIIHGNLEISPKLRDDCWKEFENILQERQNQPALVSRKVIIRCELKPQSVKLDVEDQGAGFDAEKVSTHLQHYVFATETANIEALISSGRGLVIITTFMDHVFWNPKGNCITMVKDIPASE